MCQTVKATQKEDRTQKFQMNFIINNALGGISSDLRSLTSKTEKPELDPEEEKKKIEHQEALAEQEAERKAKHERFEAKREKSRNKIRQKHGLKTAEEKRAELEAANNKGWS